MRRKFFTRITDQFGNTPDPAPTVYAMLPGARVSSGTAIPAGAPGNISISSPGALYSGDSVVLWDGSTVTTGLSVNTTPTFSGGTWIVQILNGTGGDVTFSVGDAIVFPSSTTAKRAPWYTSDSGGGSATTALTVGSYGEISFYADTSDIDLVTIQSGTTKYFTDLSTDTRTYVTPEEFGAVGNGVSDDTAAIERAITHAVNLDGTGEVKLSSKAYKVATIDFPTVTAGSVRITGAGIPSTSDPDAGGGTTLLVTGDTAAFRVSAFATRLELADMLIYNDQSAATPSAATSSGIEASGLLRGPVIDINNVRIEGFYHGIRCGQYNAGSRFTNVEVTNSIASGIVAPERCTLLNCISRSNGTTSAHHGLEFAVSSGLEDTQIIGGSYSNNAGCGIYYYDDPGIDTQVNLVISGTRAVENGSGATTQNVGNIYLESTGSAIQTIAISDVVCAEVSGASSGVCAGIYLRNIQNSRISGVFTLNADNAVYMRDSDHCTLSVVCRNNYSGGASSSTVLLNNCDYLTIDVNVEDAGGNGVLMSSCNYCSLTGVVQGSGVNNTSTAQVSISGGTGNTLHGLVAEGVTGSRAQDGIKISGSSNNVVVGCVSRTAVSNLNLNDTASSERGHNSFTSES